MNRITVGEYICERLAQWNVLRIFGTPGDFNLTFLDLIDDHPKLEWIGLCNELNAAFAADGFARTTKGLGVLVSTFGVGDLTAINGLAGSYAEHVPILHIAGTPTTSQLQKRLWLHHTFGDAQEARDKYFTANQQFTCAQLNLAETPSEEIPDRFDQLIQTAMVERRPVYLELPLDVVKKDVSASNLQKPLQVLTDKSVLRGNDRNSETTGIIDKIEQLYNSAKKPLAIIDVYAIRFNVVDPIMAFLRQSKIPFVVAPAAKGCVEEDANDTQYVGVYQGKALGEDIAALVQESDLIFSFGRLGGNLNTGGHSHRQEADVEIAFQMHAVNVAGHSFPTHLPDLLEQLSGKLRPASYAPSIPNQGFIPDIPKLSHDDGLLDQSKMWQLIADFIEPGMTVFVEGGTSFMGFSGRRIRKPYNFEGSFLWASIGWAGASIIGGAVAAQMQGRKALLVTGEGSYQETIQDLGTLIRYGIKPTILVLNNSGYTIERLIHGPKRRYNDVPQYDWQLALKFMGSKTGRSYKATTHRELANILQDPSFAAMSEIQLVEMVCHPLDAPPALYKHLGLALGPLFVHPRLNINGSS